MGKTEVLPRAGSQTTEAPEPATELPSGHSAWLRLLVRFIFGTSGLTALWVVYAFLRMDGHPLIVIDRDNPDEPKSAIIASALGDDSQRILEAKLVSGGRVVELLELASRIEDKDRPSAGLLSLLPPPSVEHGAVQYQGKEKPSIKDLNLRGTQEFLRQNLAISRYREDVIKVTVAPGGKQIDTVTVECEDPQRHFRYPGDVHISAKPETTSYVAMASFEALRKIEPEAYLWFCADRGRPDAAEKVLGSRPSLLAALVVIAAGSDGHLPEGRLPEGVERHRDKWKPSELALMRAEVVIQHTLSLDRDKRQTERSKVEAALKDLDIARHDPALEKFSFLQIGVAQWLLGNWQKAALAFGACQADYTPALVYRAMAELRQSQRGAPGTVVRNALRTYGEAYGRVTKRKEWCPALDSPLGSKPKDCQEMLPRYSPLGQPSCSDNNIPWQQRPPCPPNYRKSDQIGGGK